MLWEAATALIPRPNSSFLLPPPHSQPGSSLHQTLPSVPWCSSHRVPASDGGGTSESRWPIPRDGEGSLKGPQVWGCRRPTLVLPAASLLQTLATRPGAGTKAALGGRNLHSLLRVSLPLPTACSSLLPPPACMSAKAMRARGHRWEPLNPAAALHAHFGHGGVAL